MASIIECIERINQGQKFRNMERLIEAFDKIQTDFYRGSSFQDEVISISTSISRLFDNIDPNKVSNIITKIDSLKSTRGRKNKLKAW